MPIAERNSKRLYYLRSLIGDNNQSVGGGIRGIMAATSDQKADRNQNQNCKEPGESFTHSRAYLHFCMRARIPGSLSKQGSSKLLRRREISHICVSGMRRKSKPHND